MDREEDRREKHNKRDSERQDLTFVNVFTMFSCI